MDMLSQHPPPTTEISQLHSGLIEVRESTGASRRLQYPDSPPFVVRAKHYRLVIVLKSRYGTKNMCGLSGGYEPPIFGLPGRRDNHYTTQLLHERIGHILRVIP